MKNIHKLLLPILFIISVALLAAWFLYTHDVAVLNPKGIIAAEQRELIIFTSLLSLVVILPVFALTFFIAWKYREDNKKATYSPEWDGSKRLELLWWGIPCLIILVLAVVTWKSTHQLDPYRPLASDKKPLTIQVVALPWKWLFIYPEQDIASVNHVQFPEDMPINFEITADAPMNSFWIPQLGGQVYAMAGMTTKLHLSAHEPGVYKGISANLSGEGFAGMRFNAKASSQNEFDYWVASAKVSSAHLDRNAYHELAKPSKNNPATYYSSRQPDLYNTIIEKYMGHEPGMHGTVPEHPESHGSGHSHE